MRADRGWNYYR